jgi:DNA-binding beta-propeller fold protein YncE
MTRLTAGLGLVALGLCAIASPAQAWHLTKEIHLPGAEGWDYLSVDPGHGHLFVAHGTHVDVIDLSRLESVGSIPNTPGVHGVAVADDLGRGYISAGGSNSVIVFDLKSLARVGEIKTTGANPDAILYHRATHRVFTFNGRGRNVTVIDATKGEVIGTIPLDAKPEFAVADETGHIFVNLEDRNSIARIDPATLRVTATWPLKGCDEPTGLAIDGAHRRLFSVCDNNVMAIVNSASGQLAATVHIGDGPDATGFDATSQLAFASAGDGTLTVVKEQTPDTFTVTDTVQTRAGARTMTLDERTHRLFLATAQRDRPGNPATHERPKIVPDTFEVMVFEP